MEIKKVLTLALLILVGNNADCFPSYSSYDTMSSSDISLDGKYINNNYVNFNNHYIKTDTINVTNNIIANNTASTSTILIKANKINNRAISELAKMVYHDDISFFSSDYDPILLNIRSLLKQNDFSNGVVTQDDVEEFMKIIKSLDAKQIRNISMLYSQIYHDHESQNKYSTDVSHLYSLLQYYKDPENVIDDNRHYYVCDEIDLFFINYFLKNYTIPELIRVRDKIELKSFLTSHGYDEYYRRIVVPQVNKYYIKKINETGDTELKRLYAEDLTNTLKELDSSNITLNTWNHQMKDVQDITLPTLKKFILLVKEIYNAKPDLVKAEPLLRKADDEVAENTKLESVVENAADEQYLSDFNLREEVLKLTKKACACEVDQVIKMLQTYKVDKLIEALQACKPLCKRCQ